MEFVKQKYTILEQEIPTLKPDDYSHSHFREEYMNNMYKHIERCGRVCYRSEDRITDGSAERFVKGLIKTKHCYTGDSEVLTDQGWIKWKDYNGEKIATVNSNLDFIGYEIPERIIKHTYSGNFYEYPELGLKVTDGHTMFGMFRDSKHNFYNEYDYEKFTCNTPYKDNNGISKTLGERTFKVPVACNNPLVTDPYYELIGFWLGDGCHTEDITNKLKFYLKKERKIKYLESLCNELGYKLEACKSNQYSVNCPNIGRLFNSLYYENGNKKIEEYNLTPIQIHSIIQGLIKSDGNETTTNSKTIHLSTTSKSIKNWLLRFAPLGGYNITYSGVKIFNNPKQKPSYKLHFISSKYIINNDSRKKDKKVIITNESNEVFCVTVSTGLLLVRGTNGKVSICGNCSVLEHGTVYLDYPKEEDWAFYDMNPYSLIRLNEKGNLAITCNYRVIIQNNRESDLKYLTVPDVHYIRHTVLMTTCIQVYKELTRHRELSPSIESTRYCNYSVTSKFGDMKFVVAPWFKYIKEGKVIKEFTGDSNVYRIGCTKDNPEGFIFKLGLSYSEDMIPEFRTLEHLYKDEQDYTRLTEEAWKPEEAAYILPQGLAAEAAFTGYDDYWDYVFDLRARDKTGKAHPLVKEIMIPLSKEFEERGWINKIG